MRIPPETEKKPFRHAPRRPLHIRGLICKNRARLRTLGNWFLMGTATLSGTGLYTSFFYLVRSFFQPFSFRPRTHQQKKKRDYRNLFLTCQHMFFSPAISPACFSVCFFFAVLPRYGAYDGVMTYIVSVVFSCRASFFFCFFLLVFFCMMCVMILVAFGELEGLFMNVKKRCL